MSDFEVAIVGCGPVGALTANLLGRRGVSAVVLDRATSPHGQPRAFSCDDEALRAYQAAGLVDRLREHMYAAPLVRFVNDRGGIFAELAMTEVDFGFGYPALNFFDQPLLEAELRAGLDRFPQVELRLGHEVTGLVQDGDAATLTVHDAAAGQSYQLRTRYVLGCDGAGSATRALAGIALRGSSYEEPWLAVSGAVAPGGVREECTLFVCDWRRPAFVSPAPLSTYRMEFMLRPGETRAGMEDPATIAELIAPYVDPDRFTVHRAAVYGFHTLLAERWRSGRVFLLGDAAHQMPPFMGQGLCSGLRDAANLSWKLALVLAGWAGDALLDTYELERRPHAEEMATTSVRIGRIFLARRRWVTRLRDATLLVVQRIPRIRRFVRHFEFKPAPAHRRGLTAGRSGRRPEGMLFPQPEVSLGGAPPVLLDCVLGDGFAVLGPGVGPDLAAAEPWRGLPVRFLRVVATSDPPPPADGPVHPVVDVDGVLGAWFRRHRADIVVLRPDRFVFAIANGGPAAAAAGVNLAAQLDHPAVPATGR